MRLGNLCLNQPRVEVWNERQGQAWEMGREVRFEKFLEIDSLGTDSSRMDEGDSMVIVVTEVRRSSKSKLCTHSVGHGAKHFLSMTFISPYGSPHK